MRTVIALLLLSTGAPAWAAGPAFTTEQAERGQESYMQRCGICHGPNLNDGDFGGAPLRGQWFADHWGSGSVAALFDYVKTQMPPDNPGGLNDTTYADILAFVLQRNGYKAGDAEMPAETGPMEDMSLKK